MTAPSNTARITWRTVRLELQHVWAIARGAAAFKENVLVTYAREGLSGTGEAGHLTAAGQDAAQTCAGLERLAPLYAAADPRDWEHLAAEAAALGVCPPARAAIEMALLDFLGQREGLPLYRLLGLNAALPVPTSFTIGLDTPEMVRQKVREARGFRVLKVKLGGPNDEEIIRTIRAATRRPLRVDANEGWPDRETALQKITWLAEQGVELVEQPLPRTQTDAMRWLRERSPLPLVADEAVSTAADLPALEGAYHGVNVKIMKAGGVGAALRLCQAARAQDLDVMLGCMIETSVGITAAAHLQSFARWVDLDGCLLLKHDPFAGARLVKGGWGVADRAGLGLRERG